MNSKEVTDVIIRLVQRVGENSNDVTADTALVKDLGLESIQIIEFLCEVEDHFDIVIAEEDLSEVSTISDLAVVVTKFI